jgi:hypothetical protein
MNARVRNPTNAAGGLFILSLQNASQSYSFPDSTNCVGIRERERPSAFCKPGINNPPTALVEFGTSGVTLITIAAASNNARLRIRFFV